MNVKTNQSNQYDAAYHASVERWKQKQVNTEVNNETNAKVNTKMNTKVKNCPACNNIVAKSIKACPHCGARLKMSFMKKVGIGLFGFVAFSAVLGSFSDPPKPKVQTPEEVQAEKQEQIRKDDQKKASNAYYIVQEKIRSRLKDPDSYKEIENRVATENGNTLVIIRYSATNSFNARIQGGALGIVDPQGRLLGFKMDK